jgi:hypothetical protein
MVGALYTVDGEVEITVYGGGPATCARAPDGVHGDHGVAAIMAESGRSVIK